MGPQGSSFPDASSPGISKHQHVSRKGQTDEQIDNDNMQRLTTRTPTKKHGAECYADTIHSLSGNTSSLPTAKLQMLYTSAKAPFAYLAQILPSQYVPQHTQPPMLTLNSSKYSSKSCQTHPQYAHTAAHVTHTNTPTQHTYLLATHCIGLVSMTRRAQGLNPKLPPKPRVTRQHAQWLSAPNWALPLHML